MEERVSNGISPLVEQGLRRLGTVPTSGKELVDLLTYSPVREVLLPKLLNLLGMEQPHGQWSQPRFEVPPAPEWTPDRLREIEQMPGIVATQPGTPGGDTPESRIKTELYTLELARQKRHEASVVHPGEAGLFGTRASIGDPRVTKRTSHVPYEATHLRSIGDQTKQSVNAMLDILYGATPGEQAIEYVPGGKALKGAKGVLQAIGVVPMATQKNLMNRLTRASGANPWVQAEMGGTGEPLGRSALNDTLIPNWQSDSEMAHYAAWDPNIPRTGPPGDRQRRGMEIGQRMRQLSPLTPPGERGEPVNQAWAFLISGAPRTTSHIKEVQVKSSVLLDADIAYMGQHGSKAPSRHLFEVVEQYRRKHGLDPSIHFDPSTTPEAYMELALSDQSLINPRWQEVRAYLGVEDPALRVPAVDSVAGDWQTAHGGIHETGHPSLTPFSVTTHRGGYRPDIETPIPDSSFMQNLAAEDRPFHRLDLYGRPVPHALEVAAIGRQIGLMAHEVMHAGQALRHTSSKRNISLMRSADPSDWRKVAGAAATPDARVDYRGYKFSPEEIGANTQYVKMQLEYLASEYKRAGTYLNTRHAKDASEVQQAIKEELIEIFSGRERAMPGDTVYALEGGTTKPLRGNILGTRGPNRDESGFQWLKNAERSLERGHNLSSNQIGGPKNGAWYDVVHKFDLGVKWVKDKDTWKKVDYYDGMVNESVERVLKAAEGRTSSLNKVLNEEAYSMAREHTNWMAAMHYFNTTHEGYRDQLYKFMGRGDLQTLGVGKGKGTLVLDPVTIPGFGNEQRPSWMPTAKKK